MKGIKTIRETKIITPCVRSSYSTHSNKVKESFIKDEDIKSPFDLLYASGVSHSKIDHELYCNPWDTWYENPWVILKHVATYRNPPLPTHEEMLVSLLHSTPVDFDKLEKPFTLANLPEIEELTEKVKLEEEEENKEGEDVGSSSLHEENDDESTSTESIRSCWPFSNGKAQVTWIGHSTFLVQLPNGLNFLTDPVFADRASPVQFAGPKRVVPLPLLLNQLPRIDFILISHNHYDHLDYSVVQYFLNTTLWFVPKGLKAWFSQNGVTRCIEMDWWETQTFSTKDKQEELEEVMITCVPVQHWSKRGMFEKNTSLWGGWNVRTMRGKEEKGDRVNLVFLGDTGMCPVFDEIGKYLGPFDVSLIPIGAYYPRECFKAQHVDPKEAVDIHVAMRSRKSIGMHWGTFVLTGEHLLEPIELLKRELEERDLKEDEFLPMKIGETRIME